MENCICMENSFVYQLWAVTDCICLSGPPDLQRHIGNGPWGEIRGVRSETIVDVLHFSLERLLSNNELHLQRIIIIVSLCISSLRFCSL